MNPDDESGFPLRVGAVGEVVRDLHRRLADLGFARADERYDRYDDLTADLVRGFQEAHGLDVDGACSRSTWRAIVEAGFRLGDRFLYLHTPMLYGEDVAQLQLALGALGFDAGRVDGIFGQDTRAALTEFQRNVGLTADGIAGPDVAAALGRLGQRPDRATPVSNVREQERLLGRPEQFLHSSRIFIGDFGDLAVLTNAIARCLRDRGGHVVTLTHPDPEQHATSANDFDADVYIGVELVGASEPSCRYFEVAEFESVGGRRLAERISSALEPLLGDSIAARGMRLPVLRRTRMPAVSLKLGPPRTIVRSTPELSRVLAGAVSAWLSSPVQAP